MLEDKRQRPGDDSSIVSLGKMLQISLRMHSHLRMVFPLLARFYNYCLCLYLTKSVAMHDFLLRHFFFRFCKSGRTEHRVSFARAGLAVSKDSAVVSVQKLGNYRRHHLTEHFSLAVFVEHHVERRFQIMVQVRFDCDVLFMRLNDVLVAQLYGRMQGSNSHCYLQSLVQRLSNLSVRQYSGRFVVSHGSEVL